MLFALASVQSNQYVASESVSASINANRCSVLFFLDKLIAQLHNAPDTSAQQAVVLFRVFIGNRNILNAQVGKLRKICILAHIQMHGDHVDYRMATTRAQA